MRAEHLKYTFYTVARIRIQRDLYRQKSSTCVQWTRWGDGPVRVVLEQRADNTLWVVAATNEKDAPSMNTVMVNESQAVAYADMIRLKIADRLIAAFPSDLPERTYKVRAGVRRGFLSSAANISKRIKYVFGAGVAQRV